METPEKPEEENGAFGSPSEISEEVQATPLNRKLEISQRKEREKQLEEAQYTFKPTVTPYKKGHPLADPVSRENRFDKLYGDALKRHISSQSKDVDDSVRKDKDLTFTPKISAKGARVSRSSSRERLGLTRSSSRSREPSQERSVAESDDRRSSSRSRASSESEFTFKPSITKRAKSVERDGEKRISEHLYNQDKVLRDRMEQRRQEQTMRDSVECTFAPSVTPRAKQLSDEREVTERLNRYGEMKKKRLEEAAKKRDEESQGELTFKPKLVSRPLSPSRTSVSAPLSPSKKRSVAEEMFRELTFKPQFFTKRAPSPSRSSEYGSVHDRLFFEGIEKKKELELQASQQREEQERRELTFSPELNSTVKVREGPDERLFERLASERLSESQKIERLRTELSSSFTFKPLLSQRSLRLAANKATDAPLYDRLVAEAERTRLESELKLKEKEEEALREATFRPSLPESSEKLARKRSMSASMGDLSIASLSIHSRLATTFTQSSLSVTGDNTVTEDTASLSTKRSVVISERDMGELVRRLSVHKIVEEPRPEVKTKVLEPEQYEKVVERLALTKTKSFSLRTDPAALEAAQPVLQKPTPRVSSQQLEEIVERLQSPTVAVEVARLSSPLGRTGSTNNMSMSSLQLNLLLQQTQLARSPSKRTMVSPPKASFFGTTLEKIADEEDGASTPRNSNNSTPTNRDRERAKEREREREVSAASIFRRQAQTETQSLSQEEGNGHSERASETAETDPASGGKKAAEAERQTETSAPVSSTSERETVTVTETQTLSISVTETQTYSEVPARKSAVSPTERGKVAGDRVNGQREKRTPTSADKTKRSLTPSSVPRRTAPAASPVPVPAPVSTSAHTERERSASASGQRDKTKTPTSNSKPPRSPVSKPARPSTAKSPAVNNHKQQQPKKKKREAPLPPLSPEAEAFINSIPQVDTDGDSVNSW